MRICHSDLLPGPRVAVHMRPLSAYVNNKKKTKKNDTPTTIHKCIPLMEQEAYLFNPITAEGTVYMEKQQKASKCSVN